MNGQTPTVSPQCYSTLTFISLLASLCRQFTFLIAFETKGKIKDTCFVPLHSAEHSVLLHFCCNAVSAHPRPKSSPKSFSPFKLPRIPTCSTFSRACSRMLIQPSHFCWLLVACRTIWYNSILEKQPPVPEHTISCRQPELCRFS